MRILVTVREPGEQPSLEQYHSIEELERELDLSAADHYRDEVLRRLRAGEERFTMENGPGCTETYQVTNDRIGSEE